MKWEVVWRDDDGEVLSRMKVPGGWLYRLEVYSFERMSHSITFVPDTSL